jgi:outer membrane protein assembly factor BamC
VPETLNVNARYPARAPLALLIAAALTTGCGTTFDSTSDKVDYKGAAAKTRPLEIPPDLSQLARDSRYQPQGGVISAAAGAASPAAAATGAAVATVAIKSLGPIRIERAGQQRWLVVPAAPEQLWPQVRAFWESQRLPIVLEDAKAGVLETDWAENRAKVPTDFIRSTIGKVFDGIYDSGERDRFRTRLERTEAGTEIYVSHRGLQEVPVDDQRERFVWRPRAADPQLEAEMLSRLMVALGGVAAAPSTTTATAAPGQPAALAAVSAAPEGPARARLVANKTALEIDDPFDRAWRRTGLALDRAGFTVEDRDRNMGVYYVRYVDPRNAGKEGPGFWSRLFGDTTDPQAALRYRVVVKAIDGTQKSVLAVLTSAGAVESGENGQRIAALLLGELK